MPFVGASGFAKTPEGEQLAQAESERTGIPITAQINPDGWGRVLPGHIQQGGAAPTMMSGEMLAQPAAVTVPGEQARRLDAVETRLNRIEGELHALRTAVDDVMSIATTPAPATVQALDQQPDVPPEEGEGSDLVAAVDESVDLEERM